MPASETDPQGGATEVAPPGQSRTLVRDALLRGISLKSLALQLGFSRKNVQKHAARLLLDGELVRQKRGSTWAWAQGPRFGGCDPRPDPRATPDQTVRPQVRVDVVTDGRRSYIVHQPPTDVWKLVGLTGTKPKGTNKSQRAHAVRFTHAGHTYSATLTETVSTNVWGLTVGRVSPPVPFAAFQVAGEDPDDAWDRKCTEAVLAWAQRAGVGVDSHPTRTSRVSVTYLGLVQPGVKWRSSPSDADLSKGDPLGRAELEIRGQELQDFVNGGPEFQKAVVSEMTSQRAIILELARNVTAHASASANAAGITASGRPTLPFPVPSPLSWDFV